MVIWDEYKYGEQIYKSEEIKTKKWQYKELKTLIKYMLAEKFSAKDIRKKLYLCCQDDLKYLKEKQRNEVFNKLIQQSKKEVIIKNKKIIIYKSEIEKIKELHNINLEKTLFVLLVYCKWLDNMEWFSLLRTDIALEAKIQTISTVNQQNLLSQLCQLRLINSNVIRIKGKRDSKKQMWNIPFLATDGEVVFEFDNYNSLIYRYLNHVYSGYFECKKCKGMFRQNSKNNLILCKKCSTYQPIENKKIKCIDCGIEFEVDARNMTKTRCDECYEEYRSEKNREKALKYYHKNK